MRSPDSLALDAPALHDAARLAAVDQTGLFSPTPDAAFDRAVRLVQRLLGVPVAHFAVVGAERQLYKAQIGLPEALASAGEMPLAGSICKHVVGTGQPFVVRDAAADERVRGNPSVDAFGVRAYLGVPVRGPEGLVVGSLCGIDLRERAWTDDDETTLRDIVGAVESEIALRAQLAARHRAEADKAAHRKQADRLALVAARTINGVVVTDADGRTEWVNEGFTRITGYTLADLVGRKPGHVLQGPDTDAATVATLHGKMRGREPFSFEILNYHKDGTPYWILCEVTPLVEDDGTLSGFMAIETDVTERRRAEAALRASETQYRTVVESVRDAVLQTDAEGRWVYLNPAWEAMTGVAADECLGQPALASFHPDEHARLSDLFGPLLDEAVPFLRFESRILTRAGGVRHVDVHTTLARDVRGAVTGTIGTVSDITDSLRYVAEREARERAEEMTRLKSAFLNNMSHELRTPLTGILGFAEILAEEVHEDLRDDVQVILRGGRRLQDTLNSVLDLAQIESGTVVLHPEPLDVLAEARDAVAVLASVAHGNGLALDVTGVSAVAVADRSALHRVLVNLVGNALKFTPEGGVSVHVDADAGRVRLRVSDTGIGIDAAFLPRLFGEFTQASEGYARTHEGNGLGLSITKHLVDLMGGTIAVESAPGQGTTFTVAFAEARVAEAPLAQSERTPLRATEAVWH